MQTYMKDIKGWEGTYGITSDGKVWSYPKSRGHEGGHRGKYRSANRNGRGYLCLVLTRPGKRATVRIHRVVAEAYLQNPNKLPQVNHKNGDKTDNRVENLEWCTNSENIRHAVVNNLYRRTIVPAQINKMGKLRESGLSLSQIATIIGVSKESVRRLLHN